MIISRRNYGREDPTRDAKSIYIFCEGITREADYFDFFKRLDSRINVVVHDIGPEDDNSPLGLLNMARENTSPGEDGEPEKYSLMENDEVWLVFDRDPDRDDSRGPQIPEIRKACAEKDDWHVAISNPCFEVWLYYHCHSERPDFEGIECSSEWKTFVNEAIRGGFDSRKHPGLIKEAIKNSEANFKLVDEEPDIASTEVFKLAKVLFSFVKDKLL